jgi:hypothetical protein
LPSAHPTNPDNIEESFRITGPIRMHTEADAATFELGAGICMIGELNTAMLNGAVTAASMESDKADVYRSGVSGSSAMVASVAASDVLRTTRIDTLDSGTAILCLGQIDQL